MMSRNILLVNFLFRGQWSLLWKLLPARSHRSFCIAHLRTFLKLYINIAAMEPDKQSACLGEIVEVSPPRPFIFSPSLPRWPFMLIIRFSCNPAQSHNLPCRKYLYWCRRGAALLRTVHSLHLMVYGISSHLCLAGVAHLHSYPDLCKYGRLTCGVRMWGDTRSTESPA